jgi:hypothetical protein
LQFDENLAALGLRSLYIDDLGIEGAGVLVEDRCMPKSINLVRTRIGTGLPLWVLGISIFDYR